MTIKELSQLTDLENEIALLRKEIRALVKERIENQYVSDGVLASSKELPYQQHTQIVRGYSALPKGKKLAAKIGERKQKLSEELIRREDERLKLEQYIDSIPDSLTRQIFRLRFVEGEKWKDIPVKVGGGNSESAVRMIVDRYLQDN